MAEIRQIPDNGLRVVSTFSGAGGSCLGYRMAGYRVLWANEFNPNAQETYRLNHPESYLDPRSIREVQAEDILQRCGLRSGELDLFDGSPPCDSFSTSGKVSKLWGQVKDYAHTEQRTDDLFFEYIRLLRGLRPRAFVAENVSGLVKGPSKGVFLEVLAALKAAGYRVACRLLDAQFLGVPQRRVRTIFVGIRSDLQRDPVFPKPLPYVYSLREAIPLPPTPSLPVEPQAWMRGSLSEQEYHRLKQGEKSKKYRDLIRTSPELPCPTLLSATPHNPLHPFSPRCFSIAEMKRISSFPDDFEFRGAYSQQWTRMGQCVAPLMMQAIARALYPVLARRDD